MKKLFLVSIASLLLVSCGWTNDDVITSDEVKKEVVKVGVIAPLSGPASSYGIDAVNTYEYSVNAYNASQDDIEVQLVIEDGKCNGKDGVSAVQKLINIDRVPFIIGWICSGETIASAKIAQAKKVVMLSPTASSPEVSEIWDYVFRYWNDAHAWIGLSKHLNDNYEKITLVVENTDYAQALAKNVKQWFKWEIVKEINFISAEKDYGIIVNTIENNPSEAIVFLNQTESTSISMVSALDEKWTLAKYGKQNVIWAYFFSSANFIEWVGADIASGLTQINIDSEASVPAKWKDFIEDFKKSYEINFEPSFMYLEKEAIDFVLESVTDGVRDSEGLKAALESITSDNKRKGYFGEYYIDDSGDAVGLQYAIETIK